ncbi:hypothetical protein [Muriicola marianensis]|uniref:Uncharacterized protein n=1 Tax=Muriicola marianensis TaxID=1324801 RepID=A0ABQ1QWC0_9FLAO|nr:hypothetical protein [Muriicola marianensis]GGD45481.1 hypothetical protein GCM10011361_10540 [Muriicola marianensis]
MSKKETLAIQNQWLSSLQSGQSQKFVFNESSGLFMADTFLIGALSITEYWEEINQQEKIIRYDTIASYQLYPGQLFVHGEYNTDNGKRFSSVIGWVKRGDWIKAFEAVAPNGDSPEDGKTEINLLRASWELYSNQHRPDLIAKNVFAPSGRYFYRGKVYEGIEIADAYSYMKNEDYSIDLTPQKVIPVNSEQTYEIGIFKTGGQGLYFLMWGKAEGEWKLLLDFNF